MKTCLFILLTVSLLAVPAAWADVPKSVVVCPEPDAISLKSLNIGPAPSLVDQVIMAIGTKASPEARQKLLDTIDRDLQRARGAFERGDRSNEVIRRCLDAPVARAILLDDKKEIKRLDDIMNRLLRGMAAHLKAEERARQREKFAH